MTTTIGSISDGPRTTVADLVGAPLMIPARIVEMLDNAFLTDTIFRNAGGNGAGVVAYDEDTPLFLAGDPEEVAEFGEIPVALGQRGIPKIAVGVKKGLGVRVSREMRDENRLGDVNRQLIQLQNTMVRAEERALRAIALAASVPAITATAVWTDTTLGVPRADTVEAAEAVASAVPAGGLADEDVLGFTPDTIIVPWGIAPVLMNNQDFLSVYAQGQNPDEDIRYTGRLPGTFMGLTVLRARFWPTNRALVLQRGVAGFYSDTRPLEVTPLYPEGNGPNGGPTESWRTDTTRKRVVGFDQPKAACWINGITA